MRRILCVDDDALQLAWAKDLLTAAGMEVMSVQQPTLVVHTAKTLLPDLILLDRAMPVLDGSEVMRSLRAFPETAGIPVAFVTGSCNEEDLLKVLRGGAVDVMMKPFAEEHLPRIEHLLQESDRLRAASPELKPTFWETLQAVYLRNLRSGALVLNTGTPFEGRIQFDSGKYVSAEYGSLRDDRAVHEMLLVEDGAWNFEHKDVGFLDADDLLEIGASEKTGVAAQSSGAFVPSALLLDEPHASDALEARLRENGFQVERLDSGREAFDRTHALHFDVIVSPFQLADCDGWGLLRMLKNDYRTRETAVILHSVEEPFRDFLVQAETGAHACFSNPDSPDDIFDQCQAAIIARQDLFRALQEGDETVPLQLSSLGTQWLLRTLSRLKVNGRLDLRDDGGSYRLCFQEGMLLEASTGMPRRMATGMAAVAALIVARDPTGAFVHTDITQVDQHKPIDLEGILTQATSALNRLEGQATERWLRTPHAFSLNPVLFGLYQQVASERNVALALALERSEKGALPAPEVTEVLKDLIRRKVIEFNPDT